MDIKFLTNKLTQGAGVSGNCHVLGNAKELLGKYGKAETDAMGSVYVTVGNGDTHILLDAHLDRIGLIVTSVDKSGFLRVDKCGGCDARVLGAAEVTVWGKEPLYGVITSTPPHLAKSDDSGKAPSFDNVFVDCGLPYEKIKDIVSVGDRITVDSPVISLNGNIITGSALDDRIGCVALMRVLEILKDKNFNAKVTVLFSVQEETTGAGAKTAPFGISPDEAIAVDVSFATAPDVSENEAGKIGNGGMVCISPSLNKSMTDKIIDIAEKQNIKYQLEVCSSSTGTNADAISITKSGVKTALVSIPLRNMHTQAELADINDVEAVAQLIAAYILSKGENKNA